MRSYDFLESLGVCTRFVDTTGDYGNWLSVKACLEAVGLKHVRTAAPIPGGQGLATINSAAAAGYKLTFTIRNVAGKTFVEELPVIAQIETNHPGSVVAIEGLNEVDHQGALTWNGQTGAAAFNAYQADLYNAVKANPVLASKPVLSYTDYSIHDSTSDIINFHDYPRNGGMLGPRLPGLVSACNAAAPGKPQTITETGFHNLITATPFPGTDQATQATLVLNAMVSAPAAGIKRTFLFQLLDPSSPGSSMEDYFGLFGHPYAAKPAATWAGNLVRILTDKGAAAATHTKPGNTPQSVTAGVKWLALPRSDGGTFLVLWREADVWNETTKTAIAVPSIPVAISWGRSFRYASLYDPTTGTASTTLNGSSSPMTVNLGATPKVIAVLP